VKYLADPHNPFLAVTVWLLDSLTAANASDKEPREGGDDNTTATFSH
jgi:hypothetical protein